MDGNYEIRMGVSNNNLRTMLQAYFGESPYNLQPVSLPIDQREEVGNIPGNPWVADTGDEETDRENDRNLRNQGYMKGSNYMMPAGTTAADDGSFQTNRNVASSPALRRILTTQYMKRGQSYYMRFKSAIDLSNGQFQLDYFELVPTEVVNGNIPEDIW